MPSSYLMKCYLYVFQVVKEYERAVIFRLGRLRQILSRDSVTLSVDAVVYYRVSNPTMATNNASQYSASGSTVVSGTGRAKSHDRCMSMLPSR